MAECFGDGIDVSVPQEFTKDQSIGREARF